MSQMTSFWKNYAFIWLDKWGLGLVNSRAIPQLPFMGLLGLAETLGIATPAAERILFCVLFGCSGLSIYFLVHLLPLAEHKLRVTALLAALFYMFNPFNLIFYWHILDGMIFAYAVLPLQLIFYLKWFQTNRTLYGFFFVTLTFLGGYGFSNPLLIPILWLLLFSFSVLINDRRSFKDVIQFSAKALTFWILANAWWLMPLFGSISDEYAGLNATAGTPWETLRAFSSHTSFLNLFRLTDLYWAFRESFYGIPYYTYSGTYRAPLFISISCLIPVLVFLRVAAPDLKHTSENRFLLLLTALTLFYLFIAKGIQPPLGQELYALLSHVPLLSAFRAPIHKMGVLISINFAILLASGVASIIHFLRERQTRMAIWALGAFCFLFLIVYPYPLWTGEVIHRGGPGYPSFHVTVPAYYRSASEWMNRQSLNFRYYSMPQSPTLNVIYDWESGYAAADPSFYFFDKPGVYSTVDDIAQLPYRTLQQTDRDIKKVLATQNIKYVLLRNDINEQFWDVFDRTPLSTSALKTRLGRQKGLHYIRSFGPLDVYGVRPDAYLPYIYSAAHVEFVSNVKDSLVGAKDFSDTPLRTAFYLSAGSVPEASWRPHGQKLPVLEYRKINSTKFRIRVHQAKEAFPLIFSERFHRGWQLYLSRVQPTMLKDDLVGSYKVLKGNEADQASKETFKSFINNGWVTSIGDGTEKTIKHPHWDEGKTHDNNLETFRIAFISQNIQGTIQNDNLPSGPFYETLFSKALGKGTHVMANGYSNSWTLDPGLICSERDVCISRPDGSYDFDLVLEFRPQILFYLGCAVCILVMLGWIGPACIRLARPKSLIPGE